MRSLSPEERRRGVVAVSSGNHGRAVARVAADLGVVSGGNVNPALPAGFGGRA